MKSNQRLVQDRIKHYYQKYLPAAQEITDREVLEAGLTLGTPKFEKMKADMLAKRLDSRPKKPPPEPVPEVVPLGPGGRPRTSPPILQR